MLALSFRLNDEIYFFTLKQENANPNSKDTDASNAVCVVVIAT